MCFPSKSSSWKNEIIKKCYINLAIDLFEFLYFPKLEKNLIKKFVKFHNHDLVNAAKEKANGTFFLSGHFSNWELTAFAYSKVYDDKLNIIAKVQASRGLNKKINEFRELSGNQIIEIGFSLKLIFEKLRKNEIVCFLIDQSANPDYSVYVDFFGKKVATFSGPARIALKLRPELLLAYGIRNKNFDYDIYFIKIDYEDLTDDNQENTKLLTQRMQTVLETVIRKNPEQWLWFHKRFKHVKADG